MTPKKLARAFASAGISMSSARAHIERNLLQQSDALQDLTSKQLSAVIAVHHQAFLDGRASCKAECLDGDIYDGLYWLGGQQGVAVKMANGVPSLQ